MGASEVRIQTLIHLQLTETHSLNHQTMSQAEAHGQKIADQVDVLFYPCITCSTESRKKVSNLTKYDCKAGNISVTEKYLFFFFLS